MKLPYPQTAVLLIAALVASATSVPGRAADTVGVDSIEIFSEARNENLSVRVWYPASPGGSPVPVGEDRVFKGTQAGQEAPHAVGPHPLILLSHGSGATVEKMAWIASALAVNGFIVAGPNHPGTTSGDSTPEDTPRLWQRTDDLSAVLDRLLQDADWQGAIDPGRIGSLGFSLGGAAVLRQVGATATVKAYARYCETYPLMADCQWFAGGTAYRDGEEIIVAPFDLRTVDAKKFEQPERDRRIRAVVAVDPALAAVFDLSSFKEIDIPLHFINLGQSGTVPVAVKSDHLAEHAPGGSIDTVDGAVHFSFLPECKAGAADFLKRIGETDALCEDGGTRSRAELHAELAEKIGNAFRQAFAAGR